MQKIVMTREIAKRFCLRRQYKSQKYRPRFPFCSICSDLDHWKATRIKVDEECYAVDFTSGGTGYYHIECIDKGGPHAEKVIRLDKDRWHGLNDFIKRLVGNNTLKDAQIIQAIATRYNCGKVTAWRKLKDFRGLIY